MFLKAGVYRDADSTIQHVAESVGAWFQNSPNGPDPRREILKLKHLDAYYDFNAPLNTAKLLKCLSGEMPTQPNTEKGTSFADRGFVEVDVTARS